MTDRVPNESTNLDGYGNAPIPWGRVLDNVARAPGGPDVTWFLGVIDPDGSPHAAGVGALWSEGYPYFVSGPDTRKSRALFHEPAATLSGHLGDMDLVLEGSVVRVTDTPTLERVAAAYRHDGWPATVEGDAFTAPFNAPAAGSPPYYLYRFESHTVYGTATKEPSGAMRWRF